MSENPVNSKDAVTSLSRDAVVNWDRIIHKSVRTLDNQGMGKIIAVPSDEDTITISSQSGGEQYKIPKSSVSGFNGAEVLLNETAYKVSSSYRVKDARVYEAKPSNIITKEHPSHQQEEEEEEEEEITVPLIEEQLDVSKKTSTTQYTITKEPVTQKKTIEVPIILEELVVEKRSPKNSLSSAQGPVKSKIEIKVPLNREEVELIKKPLVKEEVVVKKKPVTETRTVSDTAIKERIKMSEAAAAATRHHTSSSTQK
jgi:uncharacterized protein (TIGR02271 family)